MSIKEYGKTMLQDFFVITIFVNIVMFVLELILILVIFGGENICKENIPVITALAISVFLVYVLVNIVSWLLDVRTAKTVMKELSEYQKKDIAGNS